MHRLLKRLRRVRVRRRNVVRALLISLLVWLIIICGLTTAVYVYGRIDRQQTADVIVVLGAGLRADNLPTSALMRRSNHGAALYRAGLAPAVICSGGFPRGRTRSEADVCRELLEQQDVPREAIIIEDRSRSTEENALYTRAIMDERGWQTALVVSDGYHLLRANWLFSEQGVTVYTSPVTDPIRISNYWMSVGREIAALHWHLFKSIFNLPFRHVPFL